MRGTLSVFTVLVMVAMGLSSGANAADMVPAYLHGHWALGTAEQACDAPDVEYFIFRDNGTFESGRSGKAEAVGFWKIDGDVVHLHLVASPEFFADIHESLKEMSDQFYYFYVKLVPFNVEEHRFEVVGVLGDQIRKETAIRCK